MHQDPQTAKQREIARRLKATYAALALLISACLLWMPYFLWTGQMFEVQMLLVALIPYAIIVFIFWRGWHVLGRCTWLGWLTLYMLVAAFLPTGEGYASSYFFAILAFPFLLFSWNFERKLMIITTILVSLSAVIAMAVQPFNLHEVLGISLPATLIGPEALKPEIRSFFNNLTVASILLIELAYFAYLTHRANQEAAEALERAQQSARAKGEFLANMSHEIRTPMNGLIGMLDVLEEMGLNHHQRPVVDTMRNSGQSLLRIINDILDGSKIEAGKLDVDLHRTELLPLIEGVAEMLRPLADEADVNVRLYIDPQLPAFVTSDSGRIRQVLLNLCSNAIKFSARRLTGRCGNITLWAACAENGQVKFEVADDGIGMDATIQEQLFQPFTQGEGVARMQIAGTGLGLTITKSLIELLEGEITVESEPGVGTKITVSLPLAAAEGDSRLPDLNGTQVLCLTLDEAKATPLLNNMLSSCGAEFHVVSSVEDIRQGDYAADAVVLLPTEHQELADTAEKEVIAALPQCGVVRFSSERAARFGRVGPNSALVQIKPMLLSDLIEAVANHSRPFATPCVTSAPPKDETDHAAAPSPTDDTAPCTGPRILVVEDNEINRTVLGKQLDLLGYPHDMAADGAEGLAMWRQGQFDAVLTDCHMPKMDGFQMTQEIRMIETASNSQRTPIIAVTANALAGEDRRCLQAGMDDYLAKPLKLESLRKKLESLL